MANREVEIHTCSECESTYKLAYDRTETAGFSKFCPFCSCEIEERDKEEQEDDE